MMKNGLWLLPFLSAVSNVQSSVYIFRNATQDNRIVFGMQSSNEGASSELRIGFDPATGFGKSRTLLGFNASGLSSDFLVKACLILSIVSSNDEYVPCTEWTENVTVGCASAHIISSEWNEGLQDGGDVSEGESSWKYSSYPTPWNTLGGDFLGDRAGRMIPEPDNSTVIHVIFDVHKVKEILDNEVPFMGFILSDDFNPGFVGLESNECITDESCDHQRSPVLELEYSFPEPTSSPIPGVSSATNMPSNTPTMSPVVVTPMPPPTMPPLASQVGPSSTPNPTAAVTEPDVEEVCGRFAQNMTLEDSLLPEDRQMFEEVMESHLEGLSDGYVTNAESLTTTAMVNERQEREGSSGGFLQLIEYTLCYRQPLSVVPEDQLLAYPEEYTTFMQLQSSRSSFEEHLLGQGISVQAGSVTPVAFFSNNVEVPRSQSTSNGLVIGLAVGGGVALVAVLALLAQRRQTKESVGTGATSNVVTSDHGHSSDPISYNVSSAAPRGSSAYAVTAVAVQQDRSGGQEPLAECNLPFKAQGETFSAERDPPCHDVPLDSTAETA